MRIDPKKVNFDLYQTNRQIEKLKKATNATNIHNTKAMNWFQQILTLQRQRLILKRLKQLFKFIK